MFTTNPVPALAPPVLSPLFTLDVKVDGLQVAGGPDGAVRRIGPISSGSFDGPDLRGRVLPGGSDWQTIGSDGVIRLDARIVLETSDGALIAMSYSGLRHGPADVMDQLARGEPVDPGAYYFRITATFTTGRPDLAWLNRTLAVGTGHRLPQGPVYAVYAVG